MKTVSNNFFHRCPDLSPGGLFLPSRLQRAIRNRARHHGDYCATLALPATQTATADSQAASLPDVVEYNLGDTTITQSVFPEDSRFRNMPVRLNGIIAVPTTGEGPFPVVVILHGTHPGCPEIDHVDRWPCDPADERPNYRGFAYLAGHLAAQGYVALSMNINAENTFGFGEPVAGERLKQIVDLQLRALATAAAGGENKFGVDLNGKADVRRLALIGHSRGGENALMVAQDAQLGASGTDGYGPVAGVLQIAPSPGFVDPLKGSPVPVGIILPMCDGDVIQQEGQKLYEGARLAPGQQDWVTSVFLERANHNYFNSTLGDDPFGRRGRLDCEPLLDPQTQQKFLNAYAVDFLAMLFGSDSTAKAAKARLAIDPSAPSPSELYGLPRASPCCRALAGGRSSSHRQRPTSSRPTAWAAGCWRRMSRCFSARPALIHHSPGRAANLAGGSM